MRANGKTKGLVWYALLAMLLLMAAYGMQQIGFFSYFMENPYEILVLTKEHLLMVGLSMSIAIAVGIPLGIVLTRSMFKKWGGVIMYIVGIGQSIPSLAVIALGMGFLGLGFKPAVFALALYALLPIVRNTFNGINSVSAEILEAGRGMGMAPIHILWEIEIPNALYVILAGVRTALIINIGTAALAFLVGGGGLGDLIFTGIDLFEPGIMLAGAIPTALLALAADRLFDLLENWLIPKGIQKAET